jgi:lipopolysaccharide transport system ATP-binding protein
LSVVLKIENVGKQYRLGQIGTGSLAHDMNRAWSRLRGKEDPYLKIGDENDRSAKGGSDWVWALKEINYEVKQGEVLGIIGKNGAGKSTLLKILSQVTTPTLGQIKVKGRIAALLEVGTGFHPDLTGRENIYLNGAILGMTKSEIKSKFDEIVEFSGVSKYIDTPVKRYSSGMVVRLGFAVAAHLEPEILIVDEVLAVGDIEFQKKCLGKMKDVSVEGRTVLFVSHNMTAIKSLCKTALYLKNGRLLESGEAKKIVDNYLVNYNIQNLKLSWDDEEATMPQNNYQKIRRFEIINSSTSEITVNSDLRLELELENLIEGKLNLSLHVYNSEELCIFVTASPVVELNLGKTVFSCELNGKIFNDGYYMFSMMVVRNEGGEGTMLIKENLNVEFLEERGNSAWHGKWPGVLRPKFNWTFKK